MYFVALDSENDEKYHIELPRNGQYSLAYSSKLGPQAPYSWVIANTW
jgi:hypothetical protein